MLILSRKPGERTRITCPDGSEIWCIMQTGFIEVEDGDATLYASPGDGNVVITLPDGEVEVVYISKYKGIRSDNRLGIVAPKEFLILREELINKGEYQ